MANSKHDLELATISVSVPVSIVVPTFREHENIPHLIELLFMDDNSKDGSVEAAAASGADWARIVERDGARGLSPAVIDGFKLARHPVIVCMDCDLSHPPEAIPQMIFALAGGQRFVIGSMSRNSA